MNLTIHEDGRIEDDDDEAGIGFYEYDYEYDEARELEGYKEFLQDMENERPESITIDGNSDHFKEQIGYCDKRASKIKGESNPQLNEELVELILEGLRTNEAALYPLSKTYDAEVWNAAMYEVLRRQRLNQ